MQVAPRWRVRFPQVCTHLRNDSELNKPHVEWTSRQRPKSEKDRTMKKETVELIAFGNLNRVPKDEITDCAHEQIATLKRGLVGRPWPSKSSTT